jgi:hypothetical protein
MLYHAIVVIDAKTPTITFFGSKTSKIGHFGPKKGHNRHSFF